MDKKDSAARKEAPATEGAVVPDTKTPTLRQMADAGELLTPAQCAELTGNVKLRSERGFAIDGVSLNGTPPFSVRHLCAAQEHGWNEHNQHSATEFRLKLEDYVAALKRAIVGESHERAVSEIAKRARELRAGKAGKR